MKKNLWRIVTGIAVVCLITCALIWNADNRMTARSTFALDTYITMTAYGKHADEAIRDAILRIEQIEGMMSAYREDGNVSYINRMAAQEPVPVKDELSEVISCGLKYWLLTDGAFDITIEPIVRLWGITTDSPHVPSCEELAEVLPLVGSDKLLLNQEEKTISFSEAGMGIDLGGIAKGYAADEAERIFREYGVTSAVIDLGGNIVTIGPRKMDAMEWLRSLFCLGGEARSEWKVGIQAPFAPTGEHCLTIRVSDKAIVSAGAYERNFEQDGVVYHHIIDPKSGRPVQGELDSVTVIGDSSMEADALSTSIYILGIDAGMKLANKCGVDVILIDKNKKIHTTLNPADVEINNQQYTIAD